MEVISIPQGGKSPRKIIRNAKICFQEDNLKSLALKSEEDEKLGKVPIEENKNIIDSSSKPATEFIKIRLLGKGAYGTTYEVVRKGGKSSIACKVISKIKFLNKQWLLEQTELEIDILSDLNYFYVSKYKGYFQDDGFVYIMMDLYSGGDLLSFLIANKFKKIDESKAREYTVQVLSALLYLHEEKGVIHRDLKLQNLLIDKSGNAVRIGDFGIASYNDGEGNLKMRGWGTKYNMAPELLSHSKKGHDFKVDIWSTGCMFFQLTTGMHPFCEAGIDVDLLVYRIELGIVPFLGAASKVRKEVKECIEKMLTHDAMERPSAREMIMDGFLMTGKNQEHQ